MKSSTNKNVDGILVRRRNPQNGRGVGADGTRPVSSQLNADARGAQPVARQVLPGKNLPPVLAGRVAGDLAAGQLQNASSRPAPLRKPIDIDLNLDDEKDNKGKKRRFFKKFHRPSKRTVKWIVIILILLVLIIGGILAYRIFTASSNMFKGNVLTAAFSQEKPLKTDKYGRTNLLVFGTSESDPGHPAAQLTDSIMMVSVDQKAKTAFMASVPRDLWVKYDAPCTFGYEGKINTVYECASNDGKVEDKGQQAISKKVGEVFGIDFQYTVHLNLAVVKEAVDALGGIDITIESTDSRGILDRNFDWRCNYKCYLVKYPNGPAHLDGEHAMFLAQARNDAGGYGLPRSNFDREANQRKIVLGMKDKATSAGFLANPVAVSNLIDSLGNNIHTSIDASEIKTFIKVTKELDSKNIQSISLIDETPTLLTTGSGPDGSSVVKPTAGLYAYGSLQQFMQKQLKGMGALIAEKATVDVLNASGVTGAATELSTKLSEAGITLGKVDSAPTSMKGKYLLYDLSGGKKPATLKKLQDTLGLGAPTDTKLPSGITSTAAFVVVVGQEDTGSSR
jgi:polyisoprenyl-teichoic acid--peptidoglycan teichoic acid transferase